MVGVGWIEGWRLTFAGEGEMGWRGAVTTIVESPGDRVFVSLYDVHPWDAAQLDELEGVTAGAYQKLTVRVSTLEGEFPAWVYVYDGYEGGHAQVQLLVGAGERALDLVELLLVVGVDVVERDEDPVAG